MSRASKIVRWSREGGHFRRRFAQALLVFLFSFDLPPEVEVGDDVEFLHNGIGTVIHPHTKIGDGAMICQGVTIGDATLYRDYTGAGKFGGAVIGERVTVGAGAKVMCGDGVLTVGRNCVIGANAVLTHSTGEGEIWAGVPARLISHREIDSQ